MGDISRKLDLLMAAKKQLAATVKGRGLSDGNVAQMIQNKMQEYKVNMKLDGPNEEGVVDDAQDLFAQKRSGSKDNLSALDFQNRKAHSLKNYLNKYKLQKKDKFNLMKDYYSPGMKKIGLFDKILNEKEVTKEKGEAGKGVNMGYLMNLVQTLTKENQANLMNALSRMNRQTGNPGPSRTAMPKAKINKRFNDEEEFDINKIKLSDPKQRRVLEILNQIDEFFTPLGNLSNEQYDKILKNIQADKNIYNLVGFADDINIPDSEENLFHLFDKYSDFIKLKLQQLYRKDQNFLIIDYDKFDKVNVAKIDDKLDEIDVIINKSKTAVQAFKRDIKFCVDAIRGNNEDAVYEMMEIKKIYCRDFKSMRRKAYIIEIYINLIEITMESEIQKFLFEKISSRDFYFALVMIQLHMNKFLYPYYRFIFE